MRTIYFILFLLLFEWASDAAPVSDLVQSTNVDGTINTVNSYTLSADELELIQAIAQHPEQARAELYLDPRLTVLAKIKSDDQKANNYYDHYDASGCLIKDYVTYNVTRYGESLAKSSSVSTAVDAWSMSPSHANHVFDLFGYGDNYIGVGITNDDLKNQWGHSTHSRSIYTINSAIEVEPTDEVYTIYLPDGITAIDPSFNWISANIGGFERVHINADSTVTSWFDTFTNLGGNYIDSSNFGFTFSRNAEVSRKIWTQAFGWVVKFDNDSDFVWSIKNGNWIYVDPVANRVFDYSRNVWMVVANTTQITSDKRQLFVGDTAVIAWVNGADTAVFSPEVDENGENILISKNQKGAYAFTPVVAGIYSFTLISANEIDGYSSQVVEINVLPTPQHDVIAEIYSDKVSVQIDETYTISWTANSTPIVRLEQALEHQNAHGVYSNQVSGRVAFKHNTPGIYTHTITVGELVKEIQIIVEGVLATPPLPLAR